MKPNFKNIDIYAGFHPQNGMEWQKANDIKANWRTPEQIQVKPVYTKEDLEGMDGIVKTDFSKDKIEAGIDVVSFLAETNIFPSKGEARKMVQGGGVSINRKKVEDIALKVDSSLLLHNKYILIQKGRRNYFLVFLT